MKSSILLLFSLVLLIGCKNKKQENYDNWVTVCLPAEPDRLNPLLSTSVYASQIESHVFMPLLQFDPQSLELTPCLAVSRPEIQKLSDGNSGRGMAYTFRIHEEAVWDDGKPVTADDYIFTMKTILNPKVEAPAYRAYFDFLEDIKTDPANPKKFTIHTNRPYILAEAALGNIDVYPEHLYDPRGIMKKFSVKSLSNHEKADSIAEKDSLLGGFAEAFNSSAFSREKDHINGCGAYRFEEWISGERIVLSRKTNWWGDKLVSEYPLLKALPEKIIYRPVADGTTAITLLKNQEIDAMGSIRAEAFVELSENESFKQFYNLHTPPYLAYYYIGFNTKSTRLDDKNVRRAIAHLLDVDAVIRSVMHGYAERTIGPIHPVKPYYHRNLVPVPFDPQAARQLLNAVGWVDSDNDGWLDKTIDGQKMGMELTFKYSAGNDVAEAVGLLLKNNAREAGVNINLQPLEFSRLIDDTRKRDFDLFYMAWSNLPTLDDLRQTWHTQSDTPKGSNKVGFGNALSDSIIDAIRVEMDEQKRNELYLRIQEIIYDEQPYIFLFAPKERIAIHKRFEAETSARRPGYFENLFELRKKEPSND